LVNNYKLQSILTDCRSVLKLHTHQLNAITLKR